MLDDLDRAAVTPRPAAARASVLATLAIWALGQLGTLAVVAVIASRRRSDLSDALVSWDGQHLLDIARHGYTWSTSSGISESPAFFPGLPWALRTMHDYLGLSLTDASAVLAVLAGLALALGLRRLVAAMPGLPADTGAVLVLLVAAAPLAIVFVMPYTEGLFCALAVWALVAVLEQRWLLAAALSIAAGTVRQTGLAVAAAVIVAVVMHLRQRRALLLRPIVAALLAPCGTLAYLAYAGIRLGHLSGWFTTESQGWGASFDFGAFTWDHVLDTVTNAPAVLDVVTVAALGAAVLLLAVGVRAHLPAPVLVYAALVLALDLGSSGIWNSKIRLLLPAFVLLVPVAAWTARRGRGPAIVIGGSAALFGAWYSAYALIVYGYAI